MAGDDSRTVRPREFVVEGQWPHAVVAGHYGAIVAQHVSRCLAQAMDDQGWSAKRLGACSGVNRQTIANVLAGLVWPDLITIAHLENTLLVQLWPIGVPAQDAGLEQSPDGRASAAEHSR